MKTTERLEIAVETRKIGKHNSRVSRTNGRVPAVIYGPKTEPINVLTDEITMKRYSGSRFESTIFALKSEDAKVNKMAVILRAIQVHPLTRRPLHVDFYAVDMTKPVRVHVELTLVGKPLGIAEGGVLEHMLRNVEIEVLPDAIPDHLEADVAALGLGEALHVSDLKVPAGVKILSLMTLTIATVAVPKEEAAKAVVAAPAAATPAAAAKAPAAAAKPAAAKK